MNKVLVVGVLVAVALSGLAFFGLEDGLDGRTGAQAGPDHYDLQVFHSGQVDGGVAISTTTTGDTQLLSTQFVTRQGYVRYITFDADEATVATFPASSTMSHYIPNVGDCANIVLENSGDSNLTLAEGTGNDLQEPDGQDVVISANNYALLTLCRTSNTDILIVVDETIPG